MFGQLLADFGGFFHILVDFLYASSMSWRTWEALRQILVDFGEGLPWGRLWRPLAIFHALTIFANSYVSSQGGLWGGFDTSLDILHILADLA